MHKILNTDNSKKIKKTVRLAFDFEWGNNVSRAGTAYFTSSLTVITE